MVRRNGLIFRSVGCWGCFIRDIADVEIQDIGCCRCQKSRGSIVYPSWSSTVVILHSIKCISLLRDWVVTAMAWIASVRMAECVL